jgi:hypothetical protein
MNLYSNYKNIILIFRNLTNKESKKETNKDNTYQHSVNYLEVEQQKLRSYSMCTSHNEDKLMKIDLKHGHTFLQNSHDNILAKKEMKKRKKKTNKLLSESDIRLSKPVTISSIESERTKKSKSKIIYLNK